MKLIIVIAILGIANAYPSWLLERLDRIQRGVDEPMTNKQTGKVGAVNKDLAIKRSEHQIKEKATSEKTDEPEPAAFEHPLLPLTKLCIAIELKELYESQIVKDLDKEAESEKDKRGLLEKLKAIDDAYPDKSLMPVPDESLVKDLVKDLCKTMEDFFEDAFPDVKVGGEVERSMRKLAVLHTLRK